MVKSTSGEGNVFAMTSIPNDGSSDEANGKANFESDPKISALTSSIAKLEQELKAAREMTADAKAKDSIEQKASDEAMEKIKDMEDRAIYIKGTLIVQEQQRIKELKASNEDLHLQIAKGSGMTVDQEREKSNLTAAYEQSQKEAAEVNVRMSQLRASLAETEQKLELAVKTRDELNSELDGIEQDVLIAKEQIVAKKLSVDAAERNQSVLQASLEQSHSEFHDLNKLLDEAKEVADVIAVERANICEKASKASQELADLLKSNEATINELETIKKENDEIRCTNDTMRKTLEMKQQEHQNILEQRSKMAKLIQLINQKSDNTEQERKALEKEKNSVRLDIIALETELPMAAKANESMKRVIKRLSAELEMINRKTDIARRGCKVADDLLQSHQSTLKTQKDEIAGIKRAVHESERAAAKVDEEIHRDEAKLKRILLACKEKQAQLNNMQSRNRELEASNTSIQDSCDYQQERCEDERSEHNKQTKILIELKTDMHNGNVEFQMLMDQTVRVKEDIARTENIAFSEHRHLHLIDEERKSIEDEARAYSQQGQDLNHKSESLAVAIDSICRQIDGEDETREALRKQYRHNIGEKDILSAQLVALELEIDKVQQNIKPLQSELALGSHKFTSLKEELDDANQKTPLLLDERQFIQKVYDRQKEQQEVLAKLEDDISKQAGKNQVLTVELGRPINLHRWRELQVTNPEKWAMIERVHNLQKKVVSSTDKLASQSSILDSRKKLLAKLKEDVSQRQSLDSIQSQLRQMKASHQVLSNEIKANESILQHRAEAAEALKAEVVELEKKRMELKTAYIVSVINS